jgi:hypothetical protein
MFEVALWPLPQLLFFWVSSLNPHSPSGLLFQRAIMPSASRDKQPTTRHRLGIQFESPKKSRHRKHTKGIILPPTQRIQQLRLFERLNALKQPAKVDCQSPSDENLLDADNSWVDLNSDEPQLELEPRAPTPPTKRITPNAEAYRLYHAWKELLPSLIDPFLHYTRISVGKIVQPASNIPGKCTRSCPMKSVNVLSLYHDRKQYDTPD